MVFVTFCQHSRLFNKCARYLFNVNMDIVNEILEREQRKADKYKSINVEKHLELDIDLGTLLATDSNDLDNKLLK